MSIIDFKGIPKTSQIVFTGKGTLDEKSYIEKVDDLNSIDTNYILNGQSVFCTENGGHYIYLPNGVSTATTPIVGSWYLKEQLDFDCLYPLNFLQIALNEDGLPKPLFPASVEWTLTTTYDNKSLWVDSTKEGGSILAGSLPNIYGNIGSFMIDQNRSTSGALYYSGTPRSRDWSGASGDGVRSLGFKASNSNSIYGASAGANIVRPTSITIKIYKRTK